MQCQIIVIHRFNRLAWGGVDANRTGGVIAAGMENGELALWDPSKILAGAEYVPFHILHMIQDSNIFMTAFLNR